MIDLTTIPAQIAIAVALLVAVIWSITTILEKIVPMFKGKESAKQPTSAAECAKQCAEAVKSIGEKVDDLHDWLGQRDADGAFPWSVRPALLKLVEILDRMDRRQELMEREVQELRRQQ